MLVRERMISPGKWIAPSLPINAVIDSFKQYQPNWMPVVDPEGRLVGLILASDIEKAEKAVAMLADTGENKYTAQDFMTTKYISVAEKTPIEEAVRIMIDYDISELPVVKDGFFSGVITEKIMMRVLLEITGARKQGVRLMVEIENKTGELLNLLQMIREQNGVVEGICTYCAQENEYQIVTMRVEGVDKYSLKQAVRNMGYKVIDIR